MSPRIAKKERKARETESIAMPEQIKFRAPKGTKARLDSIAQLESVPGMRTLSAADVIRTAISLKIQAVNGK